MPNKMKPEYRPVSPDQKLAYLIEECGEVLQAAGKTLRWGPDGVNPELSKEQQKTNRDLLWRELEDLTRAIRMVRDDILHDRWVEGQLNSGSGKTFEEEPW